MEQAPAPEVDERVAVAARAFDRLLLNTLVTGVTSTFLWFALTFWVYLQTRSVVATAVIGAAYSLSSAVLAPAFGSYVDHHRKKAAIELATAVAATCFAVATALFLAFDPPTLLAFRRPWFWLFVGSSLIGSVAGQLRSIALSTCVTMLVAEDRRDRANGRVGTVTGVSFAITSVFSGLVIGSAGMGLALGISLGLTLLALVDLRPLRIDEVALVTPEEASADAPRPPTFDLRGAFDAIGAVPGLWMLLLLAAFNNVLGGVFMALMDAYGLGLVSVETWGFLWGGISLCLIVGGLLVARFGLGRAPLRLVLAGNLVNWVVCSTFALRSSIVPLTIGMAIWLGLMPVIEAAEQTVLQRTIPLERQGRVFGFAQLLENAAAPVMALAMGPLAESLVMPSMTDGAAARAIGGWFGTGPDRGLALIFTLAGLLGVAVTLGAWASGSYRRLRADAATEPAAVPA